MGQLFRSGRVINMIEQHESLLLKWLHFIKMRWGSLVCEVLLFFSTIYSSFFFFFFSHLSLSSVNHPWYYFCLLVGGPYVWVCDTFYQSRCLPLSVYTCKHSRVLKIKHNKKRVVFLAFVFLIAEMYFFYFRGHLELIGPFLRICCMLNMTLVVNI